MQDIEKLEKLGYFYLGKQITPQSKQMEDSPLFYDANHMTTHAVCVGMTGSGKTGLGIALLEEAGMNKIPSIIIDPKGDLTNLFLTFPALAPSDFKPWIDEADAKKKGMNVDDYSASVSKLWKEGLASWGEDGARIQRFKDSVDVVIYTPASHAGIPLSILRSFAAPPKEEQLDVTALREKIVTITTSLLGLLGIHADPIKSRESILISTIIQHAWQQGKDLDLIALIQQIQKPPFDKMGALDLETFYPVKDRMVLSIGLNGLLAAPGFQSWLEGEPLDIARLLQSDQGKPKLSIISIAHLSDAERMFFVTLLLNEFVGWMRRQTGTSSLRALLYMDEIFGFFPPTAMPPSKLPMLTLLKQARAFGVGIFLVTQNPVDLDYKGLANCGTWFIGKLQTERDKARLLEGLKSASNNNLDTAAIDKMLASTGNRTFVLRSVYEKELILFQTRWTLSYLRGPLTLMQIAQLSQSDSNGKKEKGHLFQQIASSESIKPYLPPEIHEFFLKTMHPEQSQQYEPRVIAVAKVRFVDSKNDIDVWNHVCFAIPIDPDGKVDWDKGIHIPDLLQQLQKEAPTHATFKELPSNFMQKKEYSALSKQFAAALYQNQKLTVYESANLHIVSKVNESEQDFRIRALQANREKRDGVVKKIKDKYQEKISNLTEKIQRAQSKVLQQEKKGGVEKLRTLISFGSTIMGALFGRKITKGTISQTGTSLRRAANIGKSSQDVLIAKGEVADYKQLLEDMEEKMNQEIATVDDEFKNNEIYSLAIRPKKSDIRIETVALLWWPI